AENKMPSIHGTIMLDTHFYESKSVDETNYDNSNRFQIRKAALGFEGFLDDNIQYNMEFGIATCIGKGDQLKIMEAGINYHFSENLSLGIQQGHVLRGFASDTECSNRLTLEKPVFMNTFGVCHPFGVVANGYFEIGKNAGAEIELGVMNGVNGTFDREHDINAGIIIDTPLNGLAISATFNHVNRQYYDENYSQYSETGYRMNCGANYLNHGFWITSEYFYGKGFTSDSQKMSAWYAQLGYDVLVNHSRLLTIQPFIHYAYWDKDCETDIEKVFTYLEAGLTFKLTANTMLKTAYDIELDQPESVDEQLQTATVRITTVF
ncbi:MAG: hypothetical protein PHR06_08925, partial [Candidatus Cloacimonetes bacterium]|nr:hypothetical protein [Candidatus Cloacimonadota bacterium]